MELVLVFWVIFIIINKIVFFATFTKENKREWVFLLKNMVFTGKKINNTQCTVKLRIIRKKYNLGVHQNQKRNLVGTSLKIIIWPKMCNLSVRRNGNRNLSVHWVYMRGALQLTSCKTAMSVIFLGHFRTYFPGQISIYLVCI